MKFISLFLLSFSILLIVTCSNNNKQYLTGSGVLEGTEIIVSAKGNGQILNLRIDEGDEVQPGDTLAFLDVEKLIIQREQMNAALEESNFQLKNANQGISQAQENFDNIQKRYTRIKALYENGTATQQQMDDIDTQYKTAQTQLTSAQTSLQALKMKQKQIEANLKLIESQINDGIIISPATGIVVDKFLEQGEMIGLGLPLAAIADLSNLWIKLYVTETELGFVKLHTKADISIDSFPDKAFSGEVVWISPKAEFTPKNVQTKEARADLVYAVKIAVPNPDGIFKIGMPADIKLKKE